MESAEPSQNHSSNFNIENKTSANNILNESSLIHNNETLVESSLIDENIVIKPYDTEKQINKTLPYNYKEDPDNPKNWPKMKKRICIALILINSFLPYFSSVIYIPATQDIMSTFKIDLTAITSTFSLYMIICGFMPLYWAPLSQRIGRKWVYLIGMFVFTISSVLCAVSVNFAMFYVFRMLQAIFGSCPLGLVGGSISDIAEPHERGKLVSLYILSLVVSTPIGTVAGGFIDQYLDFRFIFYILTVYGGITTVITFLFFEEG